MDPDANNAAQDLRLGAVDPASEEHDQVQETKAHVHQGVATFTLQANITVNNNNNSRWDFWQCIVRYQ